MDKSFRQEDSNMQQPASLLVRLAAILNLFNLLTNQVELTEGEQEDAGVYLGGEGRDGRDSQQS